MGDKRRHQRIHAEGKVDGRMVLASDIEIMDLSSSGMQFNCKKHISTNSTCSINIIHNDITLNLKGKVTRSFFKRPSSGPSGGSAIYEVGMQFSNLTEARSNILRTIIESLKE
ncbi:MAG: PilZ domain-containing protein [Nitrospirota bacterium]|nr:MAG: PilZ domain-containing protein [Nitrospirota bacterium]